MSIELYKRSSDLVTAKKRFAIATVVQVEGSSSAGPGSKAIIDEHGLLTGWIGGGCAESTVRREAMRCIESGRPQLIKLDMRDEVLGVGMPCGGVMDVYIEPVLPKPELLIVGHGRIAETIAALAHEVNFSITVDDPLADRRSFPTADVLIDDDVDLSVPTIDADTFVVIATQHKGDHLWLQKALEGGARYVGLVSSRHRAALVLDFMISSGVALEQLKRVWAPAGLDLGAASPEEIALSIVSQMVAIRRGGSCAPAKFKKEAPVKTGKMTTGCDMPGIIRQ
jgi:xanthine dehydrogenase accessory factor